MRVTVETQADEKDQKADVVYVSFDREGLAFLRQCLQDHNFRKPGDDVELFTPDWGGEQLDSRPYHQGKGLAVVHRLELQLRMDAEPH